LAYINARKLGSSLLSFLAEHKFKSMKQNRRSAFARPIHYDDAFITSIVRYGESDCIVRIFTRKFGRINAFFKRGFLGKKGIGLVQALALARVGLIYTSNKLSCLVTCDLDPKVIIRSSSLKAFGYIAYMAELIEKFLPQEDFAPEIFSLVEDVFADLLVNQARPSLLRAFELKLLDCCGYMPELPSLKEEKKIIAFDPVSSKFLFETSSNFLPFSYSAIMLVRSMLIAKVGSINYEGNDELMMIGRIFQSRLKLMGLLPLKSVAFLKQLSRR
jgi:DNA repair protein RecO